MGVAETVAALSGFEGRGAGSDTERRAALWLSRELTTGRRRASIEPFWSRPNWALAHAWHVGLALAGSLVSVGNAKVGGALVLLALLSFALDALTGVSLGRRLTPERASQNVVSPAPEGDKRVRLILTANYDAGRTGIVYRAPLRGLAARLRALTGGRAPGWQGWLVLVFVWLLVVAIIRNGGSDSQALAVAQLIPTAALVLALALLLELAAAQPGPAAGDDGSGVGVALALARVLDVSPPQNLAVEVVLQGASDGSMNGLTRYLRRRRSELRADNTVVIGVAASGAGGPRWWVGDGPLVPLRLHRRLAQIAADATSPGAEPHRGRGTSQSFPARVAGLPAITIGGLDPRGLAPRSHQPADVTEALDGASADRVLELGLTLVDAIDIDLGRL